MSNVLYGIHDKEGRHIVPRGGWCVDTSLEQVCEMCYNTGVNLNKFAAAMLETSRGVSNRNGASVTMTHSTPQSSALKVCTKCGQSKPLSEYHQHKSGRKQGKYWSFCRECDHARNRAHRIANDDQIREYRRQYNEAHRDELRAKDRQRIADPAIRRERALKTRQWRESNPDYAARHNPGDGKEARYAVRNAVRRGELPPAWSVVCEHCQEAQAKQYHHRLDYEPENWLNVAALCMECHGKAHWVD